MSHQTSCLRYALVAGFLLCLLLVPVQAASMQGVYPIPATPASTADTDVAARIHLISGALSGETVPADAAGGQEAFDVFSREIDLFRVTAFSSLNGVKLHMPAKSQPPDNLLAGSDLYQELVFHAGLSGVRDFHFDGEQPESSLQELAQVLGAGAYQPLTDGFISHGNDYALSAALREGQAVWRFTPRLQGDETPDSRVLGTTPARFTVGDGVLTLPGVEVLHRESAASAAGIWAVSSDAAVAAGCPQPQAGQRCVEYFANTALAGAPQAWLETALPELTDMAAGVGLVNENWDLLGTGFGTGMDGFAVRMQATHELAAGNYRFSVKADDAVRVWVDDKLLIDGWNDGVTATRSLQAETELVAGAHTIRLEYADYAAMASVSLLLEPAAAAAGFGQTRELVVSEALLPVEPEEAAGSADTPPADDEVTKGSGCEVIPEGKFCAEFFEGIGLEGEPIHTRMDPAIDFYWKADSPEPGVVPEDRFSVRWQGYFEFEAGDYQFISSTDDGIRVWVDGAEVISSWKNQGTTTYFADVSLTAGKHLIKVEYYENYGWATAKLRLEQRADCSGVPENRFCGSYFNQEKAFEGEPDRTYLSDSIQLNLAPREAPLTGIRDHKYSVRWVGDFDFPQDGHYQFNMDADDGMRVWLGDRLISDEWARTARDQRVVEIAKGRHRVTVEYYQMWNDARAMVDWEYMPDCHAGVENIFCMEIYPGNALQESEGLGAIPKYRQPVGQIDFDWENGAPEALVGRDNFSIRWHGQHLFEEGLYQFTTDVNDGVRLFVDDELVLDAWERKWPLYGERSLLLPMTAGLHHIRVEYQEVWGQAKARVNWRKAPDCKVAPEGQFCTEFYGSRDFSGEPLAATLTDTLDFDWGNKQPAHGVWRDNFATRSVGKFRFEGGLYRFSAIADDTLKLWVNDELVIDQTRYQQLVPSETLLELAAGEHEIRVEHSEGGGDAVAKVSWAQEQFCADNVPQNEFCVSFYAGTALEDGRLLDTLVEPSIDHVWEGGAPTPNVPRDQFSARWIGDFELAEGEYTFNVTTDDGFRLWVGGQLLLDKWQPQPPTLYQPRIFLEAGKHRIVAEYYERTGGATAQLAWSTDQLDKPAMPGNLQVISNNQYQVVLMWDEQELAAAYNIYRDGKLLATTDSTDFADDAVEVMQDYAYQVTALWPNQRESGPAGVKVTVADTLPPSQPAELAVVSATDTGIELGWKAASDNVAVAHYEIWRDYVKVADGDNTTFVDTGLSSFKPYVYQVKAVDASGNRSSFSNPLTVFTQDGTPPSAPTGLRGELTDGGAIELRWQAATDNIGVSRYNILRDGEQVGAAANTVYRDTSVAEHTEYRYQVVALDAIGNESAGSETLLMRSGDITAPAIVTGLRATVEGDAIRLSWEPASDNVGVNSYRILRDGRMLALTTLLFYVDEKAESGVSHRYQVVALDAANNVSLPGEVVEAGLDTVCESTQAYFNTSVASSLSACMTCHVAGGSARNSGLLLSPEEGAAGRNLSALNTVTHALGSATVLGKVSGQQPHGGGTVFAADSTGFQQLAALLAKLEDPASCDADDGDMDGGDDSSGEPGTGARIPVASLVGNCASCHGSEGASNGPGTPGIAGLGSEYLLKVMRDYRDNKRASTVMHRIASGYSEEQLQLVADYFAVQPPHVASQAVDSALVERGRTLHGAYCASCHTNGGRDQGSIGVRLAGQWKPYMQRTLEDYLAGRSEAPATMLKRLDTLYQQEGDAGVLALVEFYASNEADTEAPAAPAYLGVAATTPDSITLSWLDPDDDWSVSHYEIYRDGVLLGTTEFTVYTDANLLPGAYEYHVLAVDESGNRSAASNRIKAVISSDDSVSADLQLLDYQSSLRKAALVLLGRLPTTEELAAATTESGFRQTLRQMLDASGALDNFVHRAAHETFLSNGAARAGSGNGIRGEDFPMLEELPDAERRIVNDAIKQEPVYLLQHIVGQDRPWTESLTADYTVLNAPLAKALQATPIDGSFNDPLDADTVLPARISRLSARLEERAFPHAGVLTTNAWLSRFPTTDTNRNRHRATQVFKQFLGVDLEALAQRPIDDSENGDYLVPTMENTNCMVCHTVMEPVAGAFRNWGTANRYQQNFNGEKGALDSLAWSYKSNKYPRDHHGGRWHQDGDQWYRDMFRPGFGDMQMPGGYGLFATFNAADDGAANVVDMPGAEDSLQWLGRALVQDQRFAKGTVYFWYRALFKREPLSAPLDREELDYGLRLAAFNEQDALFEQLARRLTQDRGNGAWNIKDLLIDMAASPLFRANTKSASSVSASDLGLGRLLTPEELNHKLAAVTGYQWRPFEDGRVWRDRMGVFYGGFDGGNLQTSPNTQMNSLMSRIPERMAIELSCNIVHQEFRKTAAERNLFQQVETLHTPAFEQVDIARNNLLVNPGAEDGMAGWVLDAGTVRILSGPRGCEGGPSIHAGENIFNPGSICKNQTELGRIYQQVDVTPWAGMIDGGEVKALFGAALRSWSRDNDEASVYLTFHAADGQETGRSESLIGGWEWKSLYDYINIPAQTRAIRFHIQGRRVNTSHPNNDAFADDAYLRVILPGTRAQTLGEQHIRATIQHLHQHLLGEQLAPDAEEIDRTYRLFEAVWEDESGSSDDNTCRLYRDWEDPDRTQRSWSMVMMYLLTDARFLYE